MPTGTEVAMVRSVWSALVAVPLLTLPGVPDDVAAWFSADAATAVASTAEGLDAGEPGVSVTVGEPRELHLWSEEFRAGTVTAEPVVPIAEWVAPYRTDGTPAGSVVAWHEDGAVALASVDDHAELAAALVDLPADALVVHEPMLAAHFTLAGGTVTTLLPGFYEGAPTASVETFQAALTEQLDSLQGATAPEPGPRWWVPVVWGALAAAVAGGLGILVLGARRRAGHT